MRTNEGQFSNIIYPFFEHYIPNSTLYSSTVQFNCTVGSHQSVCGADTRTSYGVLLRIDSTE